MCGTYKPHVHHIDDNRNNNDPLNLLPLCPNCHLTDQHNPTTKLEPERLKLFRAHKDPIILTPQFAPLFRRIRFLENVSDSQDVSELQASAGELCRFVSALNMGKFYSEQLENARSRTTSLSGSLEGSY